MVDEQLFKDIMARIPSAVSVVTSTSEQGYHGVTVSSFGSLSLDPPLMYACLLKENQSHGRLMEADQFVVNVLPLEHTFLAEQFAGQTPLADPGFSRVPHTIGPDNIPRIKGCLSWITCSHWTRYDGGDHTIFVGEIIGLELGEGDDPLIYFDREFVSLSW